MPDAEWFFGREALTQRLVDAVHAASKDPATVPILVITGSSSSGKPSLVKAGLLPVLGMRTIAMTPGVRPMAELGNQMASICGGRTMPDLEADLWHWSVGDSQPDLHLGDAPLLVLVDQFEKLFAPTVTDQERSAFLAVLTALVAAGPGPPTRVVAVLVLRSDFYRQASEEPMLRRALQEGQVLLGAMSVPELRSAIVEPARRAGVTVDDDLVELVLRDMAAFGGRRAVHNPGALPLMSHALMETWQHIHRGPANPSRIPANGRIERAAQQTAESTYLSLEESSRALTRRLFSGWPTSTESVPLTRRHARRTELVELSDKHGQVERVLDQFVNARLLTSDSDEAEPEPEPRVVAAGLAAVV